MPLSDHVEWPQTLIPLPLLPFTARWDKIGPPTYDLGCDDEREPDPKAEARRCPMTAAPLQMVIMTKNIMRDMAS